MAAPSDSKTDNVQHQAFPFMSLHPELRQMVYREFFSNRGIVLREKLDLPGTYTCGRRYWHFYLDNSHGQEDGIVALLQTSKQLLAEAKPLLEKYTPSHLTLCRNLRRQPAHLYEDKLIEICLPYQHITHLNLNVKCLGGNLEEPKRCPGPENEWSCFHMSNCTVRFDGFDSDDSPPPDPKRNPNLKGIYHVSQFFASLPALREIHIYDVLKHHLSHPPDPCSCPIAGTETCTCGKCQCDCIERPPLPNLLDTSVTETKEILHEALLSRFRAALPPFATTHWRHFSDYHAILEPLIYGAHIFFHEEIIITVPIEQGKSLHKALWRATYHLSPPENAESPANPPAEAAETPRQRRLRIAQEKEEKARLRVQQGLDPEEPFDFDRLFAARDNFLRNDDDDPRVRKIPEALDGRALVDFEAGLEIELVDEGAFDTVVENKSLESHREEMEVKYGKLWQWD